MRDIEIERLLHHYRIDERCQREDHYYKSERVAGAGLDAEKSADSRNEDQHSERGGEDPEKIERK